MIADRVNRITRLRTAHHPPVRRVASRPITDHIRLANKSCPHGDEEAAKRRKTPEVTGASASHLPPQSPPAPQPKRKKTKISASLQEQDAIKWESKVYLGEKTIRNSYNIKNNKHFK